VKLTQTRAQETAEGILRDVWIIGEISAEARRILLPMVERRLADLVEDVIAAAKPRHGTWEVFPGHGVLVPAGLDDLQLLAFLGEERARAQVLSATMARDSSVYCKGCGGVDAHQPDCTRA
jgi:hypothetical protein